MTAKQIAKITAIRTEAEQHDDGAMAATCDRALLGDAEALAACGVVVRAAKSAQAVADRKVPRRNSMHARPVRGSLDLEDLGDYSRS